MVFEDISLQKQRIYWVDSAKGLGVLLIIIGHLAYHSSLSWIINILYAFHIPLFFMLAGITYKRPINRIKEFVMGKGKRLLIPFLCYTFIGLPFEYEEIKTESLKTVISEMFYIEGEIFYNHPLWFLVVLFLVYCIAVFSRADNDNMVASGIYALIAFVIGWILYAIKDDVSFNVLGINRAVICFAFFIVGKTIARLKASVLSAVFSGLFCVGIALINGQVSIYRYELGNYWLFVLTGLVGSIAIIQFVKMLFDKQTKFGQLSNYAILFLGTQYLWIIPFRKIITNIGLKGSFPLYDIVAIIMMLIYVVTLPFIYDLLCKRIKIIRLLNGESIEKSKR